jgi:acyl-CoA thioester hydrolase
MFLHRTHLRTRYAEVDRMGYVYYGNYATYFEVARTEAMRQLGLNYLELEEQGVLMPVTRYEIRYLRPAFYDDELTIETEVRDKPRARIVFHYRTFNQKGELLNEALTELCFIDTTTHRPMRAPQRMIDTWNSLNPTGHEL